MLGVAGEDVAAVGGGGGVLLAGVVAVAQAAATISTSGSAQSEVSTVICFQTIILEKLISLLYLLNTYRLVHYILS